MDSQQVDPINTAPSADHPCQDGQGTNNQEFGTPPATNVDHPCSDPASKDLKRGVEAAWLTNQRFNH